MRPIPIPTLFERELLLFGDLDCDGAGWAELNIDTMGSVGGMVAFVGEDALMVTEGVTGDGVGSIAEVTLSPDPDPDPDSCATATAQMADSRRML